MKGGNIILRKLKNSKGFTIAELLVTLFLMCMLASMVVIANQMLSTVAFEAVGFSKQQLLSNTIVNSLVYELRDADNISIRSSDYLYDGTYHQTAGFVYDSLIFDFFQPTITIVGGDGTQSYSTETFREVIFVDSNDGRVYVGRAEDLYSLTGSTLSRQENAKSLLGSAMYSDCVVQLSNSTGTTGVIYPTGISESDVIDEATFQIAVSVQNTVTGLSHENLLTVNTDRFS